MAVEKMYLVNMVSSVDNLDNFLEDVIRIGEIEPVDAFNQITNRTFNITASTENVGLTEDINKLSGYDRSDDEYIAKLRRLKETLRLDDSTEGEILDHARVEDLYDKLADLMTRKEELEKKSKELKRYKKNIDLLKAHNIDFEKIKDLEYFDYRYGVVTEDGRFILKNNYENIPSLIIHLDNQVDNASLAALDEIYNIDENTKKLVAETNKLMDDEKEHVRKVTLDLDRDYNQKTNDLSHEIYNKEMDEAKEKSKEITEDFIARLAKLDSIYKKNRDTIIDKIVDNIIYE